MTDTEAMDAIAEIMSGQEWSPDTHDEVCDIVLATGRIVLDLPEVVDEEE